MNQDAAGVSEGSTKTIQYIPHHNTLTETAQFFSKPSHALAEFVDNSIQATNANDDGISRDVDVSFYIDAQRPDSELSYVTITDNGCGMDVEKIQNFATFALSQKDRGHIVESGKSMIGKFGVGAKQAGFYLGDRISIITKVCDSEYVHEFTLDKKDFEEKAERGDQVFRGEIYSRRVDGHSHILSTLGQDSLIMSNRARDYERSQQQFCIILIRLQTPTVASMSDRRSLDQLESDLANIYHFYLHPEHLPNNLITRSGYFSRHDLQGSIAIRNSDFKQSVNESTSLDITISYYIINSRTHATQGLTQFSQISASSNYGSQRLGTQENGVVGTVGAISKSLKNVPSAIKDYIHCAKSIFRFDMKIPDFHTNSTTRNTLKHHVQGVLFYYPHMDGRETFPRQNITGSLSGAETGDHSMQDGDDYNSSRSDDFSSNVFWAERLVPHSVVRDMEFLPQSTKNTYCEEKEIPVEWKRRLKAFIFFDADFKHISTNKLKILTDHLDEFFGDPRKFFRDNEVADKNSIEYKPKNIDNHVLKWLAACHKVLDKEYKFSERRMEVERTRNIGRNVMEKRSVFRTMSFEVMSKGRNSKVASLHTDQYIRINVTQTGKLSNSSTNTASWAVKIEGFETEQCPDSQNEYIGAAKILYRRHPPEIFGDDSRNEIRSVGIKALNLLDFPRNCVIGDKELAGMKDMAPGSVLWSIVEDKDGKRSKAIPMHDSTPRHFQKSAEKKYYGFCFQILNGKKHVINRRPKEFQDSKNIVKYKIELEFERGTERSPAGNGVVGKTGDLWVPRRQADKNKYDWTNKNENDSDNDAYYWFSNIKFDKAGTVFAIIRVYDGDRIVYTAEKKLIIDAQDVASMKIRGSSWSPFKLGNFLPGFKLHFYDEEGKETPPGKDIAVRLTCDGLIFTCDNVPFPTFEMDPEELEASFDSDQWKGVPDSTGGEALLSSTEFLSLEKEVTVSVFYDNDGDDADRRLLCPENFIPIKIQPGPITAVRQLETETILVKNTDVLPTIRLACFDAWGNRTAPDQGDQWMFKMEYNNAFSGNDSYPVRTNGEVHLNNITAEFDGFLSNDKEFNIVGTCNAQPSGERIVDFLVPITISPLRVASALKCKYNGHEIPTNWQLVAGTKIENLSYAILDENDEEMELTKSMFFNNSYISESWNPARKKIKGPKAFSNRLSNIKLADRVPETGVEEYEIEVNINGFQLRHWLRVNVLPNPPERWALVTNDSLLSNGVHSGDVGDLCRKITHIELLDRFENVISIEDTAAENDPPSLIVDRRLHGGSLEKKRSRSSANMKEISPIRGLKRTRNMLGDENDSCDDLESIADRDDECLNKESDENKDELIIPLKKELLSTELRPHNPVTSDVFVYVIDKEKMINDKLLLISNNAPEMITLRVSDAKGKFHPDAKKITLVPGLPTKLLVLPSLLVGNDNLVGHDFHPQFAQNHTMKAMSVTETDFKIRLSDSTNNPASVDSLKSGTIEVYAEKRSSTSDDVLVATCLIWHKKKIAKDNEFEVPVEMASIIKSLNNAKHQVSHQSGVVSGAQSFNYVLRTKCNLEDDKKDKITLPDSLISVNLVRTRKVECLNLLITDKQKVGPNGNEVRSADDGFPIFNLSLKCEDQSFYIPPSLDSLKFTFMYAAGAKKHEKKKHLDFKEYYEIFRDDDNLIFRLCPRQLKLEQYLSGQYGLMVEYTEDRPDILNYLPQKYETTEVKLKMIIEGGASKYVYPDDPSFQCKAVTDSLKGNKVVAENVVFRYLDKFGNRANLSEEFKGNGNLACRLVKAASPNDDSVQMTSSDLVVPKLRGASMDGFLFAEFNEKKSCYKFPIIEIEPGSGKGEGELTLIFESILTINTDTVDKSIMHYELNLTFTTDEAKSEKENRVRGQLAPIKKRIKEIEKLEAEMKEEIKFKEEILLGILARGHTQRFKALRNDVENLTADVIATIKLDMSRQMEDMRHNSQCRGAKKIPNFPNPVLLGGHPTIGLVTDLGYVNTSYHEAFILSWAAASKMDVMVVEDAAARDALYNAGVKVWSYNDIIPYQPTSQREVSGKLDLPEIKYREKGDVGGNPEYLVNMINLDPDKEHLRKTIFWKTFHKSILFDTLEHAQKYRSNLIQNRKEPQSTLYSRDGHRIFPDGVMDPSRGRSKAPRELDFVFGQQPPENLAEYNKIEADLNLVDELKQSLEELLIIKDEYAKKEPTWRQEEMNLKGEQRALQSQLDINSDRNFVRASSQVSPETKRSRIF